jgi:hypothetical protein
LLPDREGVILRLGIILRKMNELCQLQIGPEHKTGEEIRKEGERLAESWRALMSQLSRE